MFNVLCKTLRMQNSVQIQEKTKMKEYGARLCKRI